MATAGGPPITDAELVEALKKGDERAFAQLIDSQGQSLLRVAMIYAPSRAVAEEIVQETWLAVLRGVDRFESRSSLRTWLFRILTNTAKTRAARERRSLPFSSLAAGSAEEPLVDPDRFFPADHDRYPDHWSLGPTPWQTPEEGLLAGETRRVILAAVEELPPGQRAVLTLRDIEGCPPEEVCDALDVTDGNQRVLLHRARSTVRAALERYFGAVEPTVPGE